MKNICNLLLLIVLAGTASAQTVNQTKIRVDETILLPAPSLPSLILYQAGAAPVAVAVSDGLMIDRSTTPWTIKAVLPPAAAAKPWIVDVMLVVLDNSTLPFMTTKIPSRLTPVDVYKNGRAMSEKLDYLIDMGVETGDHAPRTITFLPGQIPQKGDVIRFKYQEQ